MLYVGGTRIFFFLSSSCIVVVCVCVYVMYTHCLGEGCGHEALSSGFLSKIPPVSFQPSVRLVTASLLSIFFFYISVCVFLVFVLFCFLCVKRLNKKPILFLDYKTLDRLIPNCFIVVPTCCVTG